MIESRQFIVPGGQCVHFDLQEYGISITVPEEALPSGFVSTVTIRVISSGQFKLPRNQKLSSAFYWISTTKLFVKPVKLQIYHNSVLNTNATSKIHFLKAKDEDVNGTFIFNELPGGSFSPFTQYGYIDVDSFSIVGISSDIDVDEQFSGRLYGKKSVNLWKYSFVIHRQMAEGVLRCVSYTTCVLIILKNTKYTFLVNI